MTVRCPGPARLPQEPRTRRWHLHRFLGFLMETGRVRMPMEIESGGRVVEIVPSNARGTGIRSRVDRRLPQALSTLHRLALPARCRARRDRRRRFPPVSLRTTAPARIPTSSSGPADSRAATTAVEDRGVHRIPDQNGHRPAAPDAGVRGTRPPRGAVPGLAAALSRHRGEGP